MPSVRGRSFISGTIAPPYHIIVVEIAIISGGGGGVVLNSETKFCLNPFTLLKVIESSNL